ncbi:bifunctional precorrin-2 dehydrogenase/sirohydrochlorin ferrochelatase [Methanococcoides orientis]|uniref:precorrin-2 dehydrogenase/sirohydrochlorin ferrochelatase family protein n=1 Tax=Methanococcoides orientis TaxID=2822137 RepID=UPI001E5E2B5E|nr:bifunctional precorrin-2 dehydrogenase/sirohydrochlorin ferrochelatase [Methanococcoides orientis]UGV39920.1 bifunctional precorrin-2 dehydrogenase/sirohydrochlorin ferrochelatase [Methanococcoides orientis]
MAEQTDSRSYLPLFIDLNDRKVIIFGGGSVGLRKAYLFSEYAHTMVVSADFVSELRDLASSSSVDLVSMDLLSVSDEKLEELVMGAFLVIPATNMVELNDRIAEFARRAGALVNRVDMADDVVIPSVIKRGGLTIGISTLGSSPAVSKYTRRKIETFITPQYGDMIKLQDQVRTLLKGKVAEQKTRKAILWEILEDRSVWEALEISYEKGYNIAYGIVQEHISKKG